VDPDICYGQLDIDLSDRFPEESKEVLDKLPVSVEDSVVYSSPLSRCRKLASELTTGNIYFDDRLKELDFGEWEGKKWDDIDSERLQEWMTDFVNVSCPGGESYLELTERVLDWWDELLERRDEYVIVITHAGVMRCLLAHVLEMPFSKSFRIVIDRGNLAAISVNDQRYTVKFINR
jgi:alpha-ribazole phosphatase